MPRIHQSRPAAAVTDIDGLCNAAKLVDKETITVEQIPVDEEMDLGDNAG